MTRPRPARRGRVELAWEVRRWGAVEALLRRAAREALREGRQPPARIQVVLVGEQRLRELHRDFLGDPSATDVISFDLRARDDDQETGVQAEIYVSIDRAREVARARRLALRRELALYVVHGCLHLCGYDDREPRARKRMRAAEARVLERLGFARDAHEHEFDARDAR